MVKLFAPQQACVPLAGDRPALPRHDGRDLRLVKLIGLLPSTIEELVKTGQWFRLSLCFGGKSQADRLRGSGVDRHGQTRGKFRSDQLRIYGVGASVDDIFVKGIF